MLLHTGVPLTKRLPFPKGELSAKLTEGWPLRRSWSIPPSRLRRATVPQFNMVASLRSHRTALRLPGVPWLRTVLRSVCSPLQPFGPPPFAKRTCDVPCFTGLTTACFRHWRRPSYAPFSFGKKEAFGRATSYDCATNQKAPLDSKGAHEARALCAEQREVSPVRQGASQASPASEEKRLCRTVECCRRQPTESRVRSSWDCPSGHCLSIVQLWQ